MAITQHLGVTLGDLLAGLRRGHLSVLRYTRELTDEQKLADR
jgi:hypothetical protein